VLGDSTSGKTNLISRYCKDSFDSESKPTIGIDGSFKLMNIQGKSTRIIFVTYIQWDLGSKYIQKFTVGCIAKRVDGIAIVYDKSNTESFNNIDQFLSYIKFREKYPKDVILIGNKTDISQSQTIDSDAGFCKASEIGIPYVEVSAKTGFNVSHAFSSLITKIFKKRSHGDTSRRIVLSEHKLRRTNKKLLKCSA